MQKLEHITDEQKKYAIDLMVTLVMEELLGETDEDPAKVLSEFISSATGRLLYDESSKLWWNGPAYIAEMYKREIRG